MLTFTAPDDSEVRIDGARVVRIRRTIAGENVSARTRIDWVGMALTKEAAPDVAAAVSGEHRSLARLTLPDGSPIWFDAKKADGPVRTIPWERQGNIRSAILLAGRKQ